MTDSYVVLGGVVQRYNYDGQLYERGKVYKMPEAKARFLCKKRDELLRPFFEMLTEAEAFDMVGLAAPTPPPPPQPVAKGTMVTIGGRKPRKAAAPVAVPEVSGSEDGDDGEFEDELESTADITDPSISVIEPARPARLTGGLVEEDEGVEV